MLKRQGMRVAFGLAALVFVLGALVLANVAGWQVLRLYVLAIPAALIMLGINLLIAAIFGLTAARSSPSHTEREALDLRRRALQEAQSSLALGALSGLDGLGQSGGDGGTQFRRARDVARAEMQEFVDAQGVWSSRLCHCGLYMALPAEFRLHPGRLRPTEESPDRRVWSTNRCENAGGCPGELRAKAAKFEGSRSPGKQIGAAATKPIGQVGATIPAKIEMAKRPKPRR
jgi:hypothetical protein